MGESVDNGGESILRALARVRVSDARARELSVAAVSTGAGSTPAEPHKRNSARPAASRKGRGPEQRWLRSLGVHVGTRDVPRVLSQVSRVRDADLSAEGGGGREGGRQVRVPRTVVYEWRRVGNPRRLWPWRMLLAQWNSDCSLPRAGARQMSHRFPHPSSSPLPSTSAEAGAPPPLRR